MADIPGLIEGAHEGIGLGHKFLKHIERTRVLLHVLDVSGVDPIHDLLTLENELKQYSEELSDRRHLILLNKTDLLPDMDDVVKLQGKLTGEGREVLVASALTGDGLEELKIHLAEILN